MLPIASLDPSANDAKAELPVGQRLLLHVMANELGLSVRKMARAAEVTSTTMQMIAVAGHWPLRQDRNIIEAKLRALFVEHGATSEQLALMFTPASSIFPARRPKKASPRFEDEGIEMLISRQVLSAAARKSFRLFNDPFGSAVVRDEQFYCSNEIAYVRECMWQCAQTGSFIAVCGESGAGKTTLLDDLEARIAKDPRGVIVVKPSTLGMETDNRRGQAIKTADILHGLISVLQPGMPIPQGLQARTVRAKNLLVDSASTGNAHLLVVDEAHAMPDATLKHLKRLHELRNGRRNLLGVLLLAQPELKVRLADGLRNGVLREVAQRCEVVELLPLDADLKDYLRCRATAAGTRLESLIEDAAIDALRARLIRKSTGGMVSMCYPLAVGNFLTRALNTAAEIGAPIVSVDVVRAM